MLSVYPLVHTDVVRCLTCQKQSAAEIWRQQYAEATSGVLALQAKKPVLYVGGGCLDASKELREFVQLTQIPVAQTLMGLGTYDATEPLALQVYPGTLVSSEVCKMGVLSVLTFCNSYLLFSRYSPFHSNEPSPGLVQ